MGYARNSVRRDSGAIAASSLISKDEWQAMAASLGLTSRELEIVRGIFDSGTEAGIAQALGISGKTVHTYLNRLYPKLGVRTQSEMILRIIVEYFSLAGRP